MTKSDFFDGSYPASIQSRDTYVNIRRSFDPNVNISNREVVFYLSHDTPGPMRVTLRNLHTFEGSIIKLWGWWKLFCVKLMMYIMKCMDKGDNSTIERIFLLEFYVGVCLLMTYQFLWDWYLWIESMYIPASNRSPPKNWFKYAFWNRSSAFVDRSLTAIRLHSS